MENVPDGNHRLAAALYMDLPYILAHASGQVSLIDAHRYGEKMHENLDNIEVNWKTADEIINEIAEVLREADGEFIEGVANRVLSGQTIYRDDSMFERVVE
jgi:hypothetical protein